jgi:hypothetical protein
MSGPTDCDLAQVKEAYKRLKTGARPAQTVKALRTADPGEEPEEDDTPIRCALNTH